MPRLNVYIPDALDLAIRTHPRQLNISKICAAAISAELAARHVKSVPWLTGFDSDSDSKYATALYGKFGLRRCISADSGDADDADPLNLVSMLTHDFVNRIMCEGLDLAIGGGTQMYEVIR